MPWVCTVNKKERVCDEMYNHFVTAFYIFGFLKRNRGRSIEISM